MKAKATKTILDQSMLQKMVKYFSAGTLRRSRRVTFHLKTNLK